MVIFSDETNGTFVWNISYINRRTQVFKEDIKIYESLVHCNKSYHIRITATSNIRLVVVVKSHKKPELWDFYGGDRLSNTATLLVVDFAMSRLSRVIHNSTASGLKYVLEDVNSSTVSLFGVVYCREETTTAYVGIMPTVYDTVLCERCLDNPNGPCGFCSGKEPDEDDISTNVISLTFVRYVADCLFWDTPNDTWKNDRCQVSVLLKDTKCVIVCFQHYTNKHLFCHINDILRRRHSDDEQDACICLHAHRLCWGNTVLREGMEPLIKRCYGRVWSH